VPSRAVRYPAMDSTEPLASSACEQCAKEKNRKNWATTSAGRTHEVCVPFATRRLAASSRHQAQSGARSRMVQPP